MLVSNGCYCNVVSDLEKYLRNIAPTGFTLLGIGFDCIGNVNFFEIASFSI